MSNLASAEFWTRQERSARSSYRAQNLSERSAGPAITGGPENEASIRSESAAFTSDESAITQVPGTEASLYGDGAAPFRKRQEGSAEPSLAQNLSERSAVAAITGGPENERSIRAESAAFTSDGPATAQVPGTEVPRHGDGAAFRNVEIDHAVSQYLKVAQGNPTTALAIAVADLLDACTEAELRRWALDQWTSRGYVRGRASTILAVQHAGRDRRSVCTE